MIHVYSLPNCPPCKAVKELLNNKNKPYQDFDVTQDEGALAFLKSKDLRSAPQVFRVGEEDGELILIGGLKEVQEYLLNGH